MSDFVPEAVDAFFIKALQALVGTFTERDARACHHENQRGPLARVATHFAAELFAQVWGLLRAVEDAEDAHVALPLDTMHLFDEGVFFSE